MFLIVFALVAIAYYLYRDCAVKDMDDAIEEITCEELAEEARR